MRRILLLLAGLLLVLSVQAQTQANYLEYYLDDDSQVRNISLTDVTHLQFVDGSLVLLDADEGQVATLPLATLSSLRFTADNTISDQTTGITEIQKGREAEENVFYNLSGQRVEHPTKGIYIHNGRKIIIQ